MKINFLFLFLISLSLYSSNLRIDNYLDKWLNKKDSVLMFNYKTGKVLYEYHSYMFDEEITIGSVFKIITTFLFLKKYGEKSLYRYSCNNSDSVKDLFCWKKEGHGNMNIDTAFISSCNKFYYSLNLKLSSIKNISEYLGLNIDFYSKKLTARDKKLIQAGNLPIIKANFYELSKLLTVFANNGIVMDIKTGKNISFIKEIDIIKKIRYLMFNVIQKGTGRKVFFKNYGFSGKTGTSKNDENKLNGLFIGFLKDKPYAIIVNIYNNIGSISAMIASDIFYLY